MKKSQLPFALSRGAQQYPFSIEGPCRTVAFIKMQQDPKTTEEIAEFIVKACNSHYDLLEACKYAFENLSPKGNIKKDFSGHNAMATLSRAIKKAEA